MRPSRPRLARPRTVTVPARVTLPPSANTSDVLGVNLGVALESLLDHILDRSRLGTRFEGDVVGNAFDPDT